MSCTCKSCKECGGSGIVWFAFDGEYLGNRRADDLDYWEDCPECEGSGVIEVCGECYTEEDFGRDQYEEEA